MRVRDRLLEDPRCLMDHDLLFMDIEPAGLDRCRSMPDSRRQDGGPAFHGRRRSRFSRFTAADEPRPRTVPEAMRNHAPVRKRAAGHVMDVTERASREVR